MRMLTSDELIDFSEELKEYALWQSIFNIADDIYGPGKVHEVKISTYGEYNDEGGTDYRVSSVKVEDAEGAELGADPTTDWWQNLFKEHNEWEERHKNSSYYNPISEEEIQAYIEAAQEKDEDGEGGLGSFELLEDSRFEDRIRELWGYELPSSHREYGPEGTYKRNQPPTLTYPEVFVND